MGRTAVNRKGTRTLQKSRSNLNILGARKYMKSHADDKQTFGATVKNSLNRDLCSPVFTAKQNTVSAVDKPVSTVIPRLTKIIRSGIAFVSRNVISRRFV